MQVVVDIEVPFWMKALVWPSLPTKQHPLTLRHLALNKRSFMTMLNAMLEMVMKTLQVFFDHHFQGHMHLHGQYVLAEASIVRLEWN